MAGLPSLDDVLQKFDALHVPTERCSRIPPKGKAFEIFQRTSAVALPE